ncbi:MAG: insulinase family protein [Ignavibacteriales bacterium]|nr:insulinase family protein [Ignavibacteriales bacterium]
MKIYKMLLLKDVHDFYNKWYGPNNATLVVAGDFDVDQTKEWIEKYFGEIKPSAPVNTFKTTTGST